MSLFAKAEAHANLALVKYWGKKDERLILPFNSSVSMTLKDLYTITSFRLLPGQRERKTFAIDGKPVSPKDSQRVFSYVDFLLDSFGHEGDGYEIDSHNSMPASVGLASSSSAFAALGGAVLEVVAPELDKRDISRFVRRGSGSATRSVYGGFVEWVRGDADSGSYALPIDETPSLDLEVAFLLLSETHKKVSSRVGMRLCKETSPLFKAWVTEANEDVPSMVAAIKGSDFTAIGKIAERNAIMMHETTQTADPPFTYLTTKTRVAIGLVEDLRKSGCECYWTLDAGPNPAILFQKRNSAKIERMVKSKFPNATFLSTTFGPGLGIIEER